MVIDFLFTEGLFEQERWGRNIEEFQSRFDPETTDGEGPIRLKNLYFTYLVALRAIAKAAPVLEKEFFYTGKCLHQFNIFITPKEIGNIC